MNIKTMNIKTMKKNKEQIDPSVLPNKNMISYCENNKNMYQPKCNTLLLGVEKQNRNQLSKLPKENAYLYPNLNDPNFIIKIAEKKEFSDTKYDGSIYNVKEYADMLSKMEFELSPHQAFVRNFLSFQTPYNSLLLYHGLGSGKTCSAIGVCEEMRDYLKQMGISKRIIIVASPNVQDNFRLQLFDERKLKMVDGLWSVKGCIGTKLLKEINPTNMKGLTKEKVISQVNTLIQASYYFVGYTQFSNDITRISGGDTVSDNIKRKRLQEEYSNGLIVIDEVHNIGISEDNENKNVAKNLMYLVSVVDNMRLLFLLFQLVVVLGLEAQPGAAAALAVNAVETAAGAAEAEVKREVAEVKKSLTIAEKNDLRFAGFGISLVALITLLAYLANI